MKTHSYPELAGEVVLITGGTSGIGRATALAFSNEGSHVVVSGRRENEGLSVAEEIKSGGGAAVFVKADVTRELEVSELVAKAIEAFGRLDIAVNNAGAEGNSGSILDQTVENYRQTFDVNVLGIILAMKYEIPAMLRNKGGSIINIASVAGLIGVPKAPIYAASKHAVIGLTKSVALDYARQGIRVNAVSPAAVDTAMLDRILDKSPKVREEFAAIHPLGRYGKSEEIADAILFLASKRSSFITGHSLTVDGGRTAGVPLARRDMSDTGPSRP